ncbi:MAG TPA: type II and III secretion system protein family protein [Caulobacteraceae bacterium]|jgi:pilus assembly protein CpaC
MPVSRPFVRGLFAALIAGAAVQAMPGPGHAQLALGGLAKGVGSLSAATTSAVSQAGSAKPAGQIRPAIRSADSRSAAGRAKGAVRPADGPSEPSMLYVDLSTAGGSAKSLNLPLGKSAMVDLPADARDVLVTNPAVADAVLRSRRRISVLGVAPGDTDAVFFDDTGKRMLTLDIHVSKDSSGLAAALGRILPGAKVRVESVNDSLVLSGEVASSADAAKAVSLAERFVAKPEQVVNLMTITSKEQVMLKVRVVEIQRSIIKQLGFNTSAIYQAVGGANAYKLTYNQLAGYGVNGAPVGGGALTGGYADSKGNTAAAGIQAFERVGLVRTLAEPNLTAVSGESAKFLAGGEYPVPIGQDNEGRVTVEFKPYGIGLNFTPVVLSGGRISLKIATEVSELSTDGAFAINTGASSTLSIPSLKLRRTETTVEMPSGGAMMIAGLLQQQTKQDIDKTPGLADMPVLGALFRSRDYLQGETELAIIVEPVLVDSTSPDKLQTPVDGLQMASDGASDLLGKLNKASNVPPAAIAGKSLQGPYGYVIE